MNKRIYRFVVIVLSVVVSIFCIALFTACNDTRRYSNEIFITDFSGTFRLSLDVKVQKHTFFPSEYNSFVYKKGLDALYNELSSSPLYGQAVSRRGDALIIDYHANNRIYSFIIYSDKNYDENGFDIHSMSYALGEWSGYKSVFFPAYLLDKKIDSDTNTPDTTYNCEYTITQLQTYYKERGYLAKIAGNELKVTCLLSYPKINDFGSPCGKAVEWSILYEAENVLRFVEVSSEYAI